ncbi:cytochrome c [Phenylobacterium sp.]|uniref:c-type cytochrome n=1 Tax=Phenylobacterium sp. TaxID=1871053 RepID=UPI0035AF5C41
MTKLTGGRRFGWVVAGVLVAASASAALAATAAQNAVSARQENFKHLGGAFKTINDELKGGSPDMAKIGAAAAQMDQLAAKVPTWFPKGSGVESGAKTRALPEVWSDAAGFAAAERNLQTEAAKLDKVASSGDLAALRAQVKATGGTCKSCHDKYRAPEK